jgi:hypothetical protein
MATYYLGLALERQERRGEAISAFQAAVKLKPDFAEAKAKLAAPVKPASSKADAPVMQVPVRSNPAPSEVSATPRRGAMTGKVTVLQQHPSVYGKVLLTFTVQPDEGGPPVSVEMHGRRRGAPLQIGDSVELRGRPRGGLLKTRQVRNLSQGGAPVYVVGAGCLGTAVLLLGAFVGLDYLIFRAVFG